jgi:hypothetical protein
MSQFFSSLLAAPAPIAGVLGPILTSIGQVWAATWWFFLPLILIVVGWDAFKMYAHVKWLRSIKWVVLEIKVPKNVLKTPKAMEQIFAAAHTPYTYGMRWQDKYLKGQGESFMSFELVGRAGETHFYLRVPTRFRNMMESSIFAQYPEAEITEVHDYLEEMPKVLPNDDFDVAGYEVMCKLSSFYPLRTYPDFEESIEEQRLDPVAPLIEAMEKMQGDQQLWIQFVVTPDGEDWVKAGEKEIAKIHGIEEKHESKGFFPSIDLGFTIGEALRAPFEHPGEHTGDHKEEAPKKQRLTTLTASEKEKTEAIARKIKKLGLKTTIRFMAIERRGETQQGMMSIVFLTLSYLRQFNDQLLQSTKPEPSSRTFSIYGMFKGIKTNYRKRLLWEHYHHLEQNHHAPTMNIEELATMFHFPITAVSGTGLEKIESKKGSPPATLPVLEEDNGLAGVELEESHGH